MLNIKQLILLTCIVVLAGQQGFAQGQGSEKLTLAQAVSRAISSHPLVLRSQSDVTAAQAAVGEAQSAYYPSITGSASYTRVEPNQSVAFPGLGTFALSQENNWNVHIGVAQVLYAAGRRAFTVELAQVETAAARVGVEQAKINIAYQTVQAFYTALFVQKQIQSIDRQLSDLQQHLSVIQGKQETGSATKYDVLATGVRVAAMKNDLIEAQNQERKQLIALKGLVGLSPTSQIDLEGSLPEAGALDAGQSSYLAQAHANRPDMKQAMSVEDSAGLDLQLVRVEGLPTVSARAQTGFKNGLLPDESSLTFNWSAGVEVSVPIFNGLEVANKIKQAQGKLEAAKQNSAAVGRIITTQVLQAYQDVAASRQQVKGSLAQMEQALQALDEAKVQYNLGVITNVEYLDAESSLEQAQFANLSSIYHEVMSEYALKQAVGQQIWR